MKTVTQTQTTCLEIIKASQIEPKDVKWLWYPFIPAGKVTLIQGDPGDGKSTFMLAVAALLTRGEPLPFTEEKSEPVNVIYQSTEDDAEDTIVPRFMAAKGDFNHLIQVAAETGCAIFIINHLNKMYGTKAIYRTPGSIDIVGAVRSALLIGRDKCGNESERVMVQQKSNLAPTGSAIVFSVGKDGVTFIEQTEKTADELLAGLSERGGRPSAKVNLAEQLIREMLTGGEESTL